MGLERNPEVIAARAEWQAARARARIAWSPPDPTVGVEFEQLRRLDDLGEFGERSIGVNQTIESPVTWWLRGKAADHEAEAVREAVFELTRLNVASRVAIAFDRALSRQQKLGYEVAHDSLLQEFASKTGLRFVAGDVPALEVQRAEVEAARAASRLLWARNELAMARVQLAALIGTKGGGDLEDLEPSDRLPALTLSLEELQQRGLQRRPDLRGADRDLESHRAQQGASRAGLFPDLHVGVARQTLRDAGGSESLWRFGLSLEVPLWAAGRQRGRLAEAKAAVVSREAQVERVRREVLLEVEMAYRGLMTAAAQVKLFDERILQEAEFARKSASRSYEQGKATYLDVLDSQRTLLLTRTEYADILLTYREAWTALERASGGGLER
jgi:cobalt-zinc-cadmium efflux system outer membrane protein